MFKKVSCIILALILTCLLPACKPEVAFKSFGDVILEECGEDTADGLSIYAVGSVSGYWRRPVCYSDEENKLNEDEKTEFWNDFSLIDYNTYKRIKLQTPPPTFDKAKADDQIICAYAFKEKELVLNVLFFYYYVKIQKSDGRWEIIYFDCDENSMSNRPYYPYLDFISKWANYPTVDYGDKA